MSPYFERLRRKVGNELLLVPSVAAVIHNEAGELLLQEKAGESWSLPAGAIEPGESPEEAVRREVLEETGYEISPSLVLGVLGGSQFRYEYPNGDLVEYLVILYRCQVLYTGGTWSDPETKSIRYFTRKHMPTLALPYPASLLWT